MDLQFYVELLFLTHRWLQMTLIIYQLMFTDYEIPQTQQLSYFLQFFSPNQRLKDVLYHLLAPSTTYRIYWKSDLNPTRNLLIQNVPGFLEGNI